MTIRFGFMEKKSERCGARKLRPAHWRVRIDYAEEVYARSWHNAVMTPRAITIRPAEPRDAQAIALMSRDFIEAGRGWKYDARRARRAIRDRAALLPRDGFLRDGARAGLLPQRRRPQGRGAAHAARAARARPGALHLAPAENLGQHLRHDRKTDAQLRPVPHVVVEDVLAVAVEVLHMP